MSLSSEQNQTEVENKTAFYPFGPKPLHAYLQKNAQQHPAKTAYIYYGYELSWEELWQEVQKTARFFQKQNMKKGDRIGLFMQNCPQYIISHYAVQYIGAIVCPLNPMYKENELEYLIEEAGIRAICCSEELLPVVRSLSSYLDWTLVAHYADYLPEQTEFSLPEELKAIKCKKRGRETTWSDMEKNDLLSVKPAEIDFNEDIALMAFTSGTTGRPKAAMLTFKNALFKTAAFVQANEIQKEESWLAVMPLCHIAGMTMGVNIPVFNSSPCVLFSRFHPKDVLKALQKYKVTVWYSIASMNEAILSLTDNTTPKLTSLRINMCTSFGMPVTEELAYRWKKLAPNSTLFEAAYGLSETHTVDTYMPKEKVKFGSVGKPIIDTDIVIRGFESKEPLPPGVHGEISVKNPGVFKGYWNRLQATAATLKDGWVYTGDVGYVDEDGYLFVEGRIKEMIKCSGNSVFPEEVETLLKQHPAVSQSAVIGIPDDTKGESVKAFIVLKPGKEERLNEKDIKRWAKENMAAYKVPVEIEFRSFLPTTSTGKILRRALQNEKA
ncbi:class I adenylate-forming enzyme family protein [Alteribacillus sp. YIM 98480]|uniref:class I adenylate-forming enzyme family protein n=1 Tax=Alteribacillus sp. YIM 98480 TaxID=2606599 RepID=UPI00131BB695|nr:class I adenylate-forming enzyme family protein [Alteribacillus sp. YIM 98480]